MLLPFAFQLSQYILGPLLFILSTFIILIILLQRGRGGGLAGALGGAGGSSALGVKAGDIFTRITGIAVCVWIVLCAFVCWLYLPAAPDIVASPQSTPAALSAGPKEGEVSAPIAPANTELPKQSNSSNSSSKEAGSDTKSTEAPTPSAEGLPGLPPNDSANKAATEPPPSSTTPSESSPTKPEPAPIEPPKEPAPTTEPATTEPAKDPNPGDVPKIEQPEPPK